VSQLPPVAALGLLVASALLAPPALAGTLSRQDVQILGKVLGFVDPTPTGVIAVVYAGGDDASKREADAIAGYVGDGLKLGGQTLKAKVVDAAALGDGAGIALIIAAQRAAGDAVMAVAKSRRILCVTGDIDALRAGKCVMAIKSDPKVEITVSHVAIDAVGVDLASAFRMMIREL
jgi:hypothetical protein